MDNPGDSISENSSSKFYCCVCNLDTNEDAEQHVKTTHKCSIEVVDDFTKAENLDDLLATFYHRYATKREEKSCPFCHEENIEDLVAHVKNEHLVSNFLQNALCIAASVTYRDCDQVMEPKTTNENKRRCEETKKDKISENVDDEKSATADTFDVETTSAESEHMSETDITAVWEILQELKAMEKGQDEIEKHMEEFTTLYVKLNQRKMELSEQLEGPEDECKKSSLLEPYFAVGFLIMIIVTIFY